MRALLICLLFFVSACSPDVERVVNAIGGRTMGTTYSVRVPLISPAEQAEIGAEIDTALDDINASMSTYQADSAISRFNRSRSTDWQNVPGSLAFVTQAAQLLSEQSDGAFDATVAPLLRLWGFGSGADKDESVPSNNEVADALQITGPSKLQVQLSPPALRKQVPELEIDLSAIAKGYAVDAIAALIEDRGHQNYLVEIGGELRVSGFNADGELWAIGVENPAAGAPTRKLNLSSGGIATSGDYRNFQVRAGQRYAHIIDPRSGFPVSHELASVTVLHKNAMLADGWSTALMVLGVEGGLTLANTRGLAAYFIVRADDGYLTRESQRFRAKSN